MLVGLKKGTQIVLVISVLLGWTGSLQARAENEHPLETQAGGNINGKITDAANGNALSGVEMYVDNGTIDGLAYTDANGNYTFSDLPAGEYNVVATKSGYAKAHRYGVAVSSASTTSGINFELTTQMGSIAGRVTGPDGKPIAGVGLLADTPEGTGFGNATTDGNGEYLITNLAPMIYHLHAAAPGYAGLVQLVEVEDGETSNADFVLGTASGGISGRITKGGQPASYAGIYVNSSAGSSQIIFKNGTADGNGNYVITDLPPGEYDVHVSSVAGYANQVRYEVPVGASMVAGVDFNLTNGDSTIVGRVMDIGGNPVEGVRVQAFLAQNPGTWAEVHTDENGAYRIERMWAGKYHVYASLSPYPQAVKNDVVVASGTETYVDFVIGLERALAASPPSITVMVEGELDATTSLKIDITTGGAVTWTAETDASWLFLGASGSNKTISGQTGNTLVLRFEPSGLAFGEYETELSITSPDAIPASVKVSMLKVRQVNKVFLPDVNH